MKNIGKTIDKLITLEPGFEKDLTKIKNKWARYPKRHTAYWKELLNYLNSPELIDHPKRAGIRDILIPTTKNKPKVTLNTFELITASDIIVGAIPENIADKVRKQDRQAIEHAKLAAVANMTGDEALICKLRRNELLNEIMSRKIWIELKDHFKLWLKNTSYTIKITQDNLLVLVELHVMQQPDQNGPRAIRLDNGQMGNFLRMLGLDFPPNSE